MEPSPLHRGHNDVPAERPSGRRVSDPLQADIAVVHNKLCREHERLKYTVINLCAPTNLDKEAKRTGAIVIEAIKRNPDKNRDIFTVIHILLRLLCQCSESWAWTRNDMPNRGEPAPAKG